MATALARRNPAATASHFSWNGFSFVSLQKQCRASSSSTKLAASSVVDVSPTTLDNDNNNDDDSITLHEIYQELQWLSREIRRHDALYYNNNNNLDSSTNDKDKDNDEATTTKTTSMRITDDDYDALVRREEEICRHYPELLAQWEIESGLGKQATRVGGRVGISVDNADADVDETTLFVKTSTTSRFQKRHHLIPMLSLDNVTDKAQLYAWLERIRKKIIAQLLVTDNNSDKVVILTEPKLDGLSLSLRYKLIQPSQQTDDSHYELEWASTRGDGKKGQDVTLPVVQGMKLPTRLPVNSSSIANNNDNNNNNKTTAFLPTEMEIRGEVVLPKSIFEKLKRQQQQQQLLLLEEQEKAAAAANNTTTITSPASPLVQSFSNARNAASGILLRKYDATTLATNNISDTENHTNTTTTTTPTTTTPLELQSMLQFYAYDIVAQAVDREFSSQQNQIPLDVEWLQDAMASRQQLHDWGFQVSNPVALTTLEWKKIEEPNSTVSSSVLVGDSVGISSVTNGSDTNPTHQEFEPWTDHDIQPMLSYHTALGQHRELLQQQKQQEQQQKSIKTTRTTKAKIRATSATNEFLEKGAAFGDYDMDGCVHKVSSASLRRLIGNANRAPRWAVAHKFPSQSAITSLVDIEVQVGRKSGALTPVAVLQPVELAGGVTVTRATLHNFQHMQQLLFRHENDGSWDKLATTNTSDGGTDKVSSSTSSMLLAKGTKVLVRRAGDVIPQVVQLAEPPKTATSNVSNCSTSWIDLSSPSHCPACGSKTVADKPMSKKKSSEQLSVDEMNSGGPVLRCSGPPLLCPPRAVGALVHAYSRDALDISGLSEAKIQQLSQINATKNGEANETMVDASLISLRYPSDIFRIAKDPAAIEAIATLPGWGPKSSQNLAESVNRVASNGVSLARFIYSLSIRFAGVHSSKIIATAYGTASAFLGSLQEASQMDLDGDGQQPFPLLADKENEVNKGIGPALLSSLVAFSREKELVQAAIDLARVVKVLDDEDFISITNEQNRVSDDDQAANIAPKPFSGMKVVFTGSLSGMNLSRKEAQSIAKAMGAKATPGTISKATDVVVVGENGGGKKLDAAESLGIRIIQEDEFRQIVASWEKENN